MRYQTEPITMWFDRRLVLRPSPIDGIGTFAIDEIPASALLILVTGGLIITAEQRRSGSIPLAASMYNEESIAEDSVILTPKLFHYYINHACEPNAVDLSRNPTVTQYVALRTIQPGEEITADYYDETTLDMCACRSAHCRWKQNTAQAE